MSEISEIKNRINILDLVSEYVSMKRAGSNYTGLCPFHNEKSPSFMVSEEKQIFHCFGCGAGGDIYEFLMQIEGIEFRESLKILAKKAGVTLKMTNKKNENKKSRVYDVCEESAKFFAKCLQNQKHDGIARSYLDKRGISNESMIDFGLGYSPFGWGDLRDYLLGKGFTESEMTEAGMLVNSSKTGKTFDRFRNRLMFPIYNAFGNVIGFSARVLDEKNDTMGKYVNSPQTPVYNKSEALYGLFQAKDAIKRTKEVIFVEGQIDVIACHAAGIKNVVASSGTALTPDHVKIISRYAEKVKLCFDGDKAGQLALLRASKIILSSKLEGQVVKVLGGKDPDELIQKDPEIFIEFIRSAQSILDYYFEKTLSTLDRTDAIAKDKVATFLMKLISFVGSPVQKVHYMQSLSRELDLPIDQISAQVKRLEKGLPQAPVIKTESKKVALKIQSKEEKQLDQFLALLHRGNFLWQRLDWDFSAIFSSSPMAQKLYKVMAVYYNDGNDISKLQLKDLENFFRESSDELSFIQRIFLLEESLYNNFSDAELIKEFEFLKKELKRSYLTRKMKELQGQLRQAESQKDQNKINEIIHLSRGMSLELSKIK